MPELDPADRGPQPEGAPSRQEAAPASSTGEQQSRPSSPDVDQSALKQAEDRELDRVRQQLSTVKQEFVQTKAQEEAKQQIAKETRGLSWWQRASQAIRHIPSTFSGKTPTGQRAQEYTKDYHRREEIKARLAAIGLSESEGKQLDAELAQLEAKLTKGQGVELTDEERQLFNELERIIATKRGELDLEDQKLKDRAEAGKLLEFIRSHPNAKAVALAAGVGLVAGAAIPLLGVFGTTGLMAIQGGLAGGVAGLAGKEARVHAPTEWARDVGLLTHDKSTKLERFKTSEEMAAMPNQELARAVGTIKNALEQGKVGGSRGEYFRLWSLYRQANDVLISRSQENHPFEQETVDQAGLRRITEPIQAKMRATDDYGRLLRNALSEQEWETYHSIQRGKGKQEYGAAILGAAIGAAVGGISGVWSEQRAATGGMQDAVEEWHRVYREGILRQHERAVAKSAELAAQNIQAMGMEPSIVTEFAQKVGRESVQSLADFTRNYNISLAHPLYEPNVSFGQWLTSNAEWFRSLTPQFQAEVLSHPNLGPILLERGATSTTLIKQGLYSLGALVAGGLGRKGLERLGKSEITQGLKASEDRYGEAGKAAWEAAKAKGEAEKKATEEKEQAARSALEEQRREAAAHEERRRRQEEEEPKKLEEQRQERLKLLRVGQRFELTVREKDEERNVRQEYRINSMGQDPQSGRMVAEMVAGSDRRLVDLVELIDPAMSPYEAKFVGFANPEAKPTQAPFGPEGGKKETPPLKDLSDEEVQAVIAELGSITDPDKRRGIHSIRDRLVEQGILVYNPKTKQFDAPQGKDRYKAIKAAMVEAFRRTKQKE